MIKSSLIIFVVLVHIGFSQCVVEKSPEYLKATENFRKLIEMLESQFLSGTRNNKITNADYENAYNDYKSWNPKVETQVQLSEPQGSLVTMLVVLYKQLPDPKEMRRIYMMVRPLYRTYRSKKVLGYELLRLVQSFALDKPITRDQLERAKDEYETVIEQVKSLGPSDEEHLENILTLISRIDVQIVKDEILSQLENGKNIDIDSMRKLFFQKYEEKGYIIKDGQRVFLFEDYYQELLKKMNPNILLN